MRSDAVDLHEEAAVEYDAAFDWYLQRSPDAALKFDAEVERAFTQIVDAPQRWAAVPYSTRRFLLRQFPFTLIYRERPSGVIQIVPVAHTSRKPGYWKLRL
jgi:plasmid stabilization system protein ParE